jgi:NADH-quinone oxidoreductase subunit F
MDLHFTSAMATEHERAAIDALLGPQDASQGASARARRHLLLPALHAVQDRIGWISGGAINYLSQRLEIAPADAYGVATFYALLSTKPSPPRVVWVCDDIACRCAGAETICTQLAARFGAPGTWMDGAQATWRRTPCLGECDRAPAALIATAGDSPSLQQLAPANAASLQSAMSARAFSIGASVPRVGGSPLRLLQRAGRIDPESLDAYRASGGYAALKTAFEIGPQRVIAEIVASGLLGRGGAAFPTGKKMEAVARAPGRPHYLVCNADESEPGTFKDRVLMECDPFALVEAMTIAAYATGCEHGFVYVRGEYPLAAQRLENAIARARANALLGSNVMDRGFAFDIELRRGGGAYICGEETALFNSIEGKRGEPRNKPPFPVEAGLFGKPTQINNVETLANLPWILLDGAQAYKSVGTSGSTGTRLFCLSGAVAAPGVYEVAHGTTLGALVEMAGGLTPGRALQAILLGGAAGTMLGPESLALPLTFEDARAIGATLGSGVVMLFDDRADLGDVALRIARFFREESCGQCVPCRVGTVRQEEALERLACGTGGNGAADAAVLDDVGRAMRDASICGLGQTAASAIDSMRARWKLFANERPA